MPCQTVVTSPNSSQETPGVCSRTSSNELIPLSVSLTKFFKVTEMNSVDEIVLLLLEGFSNLLYLLSSHPISFCHLVYCFSVIQKYYKQETQLFHRAVSVNQRPRYLMTIASFTLVVVSPAQRKLTLHKLVAWSLTVTVK